MGYYTEFSVQTNPKVDKLEDLMRSNEDIPSGRATDGTWSTVDSQKWYEHEDDMKHLSQTAPSLTFAMRGIGDNAGDEWIKYFRNGRSYKHELKSNYFDSFDESRLQ